MISDKITALVTGGSRGIGRAISLKLASTCAERVFVNYLQNDEEAEKTKKCVEDTGCQCFLEKANMLYPEEIDSMFTRIKNKTDHLDVFIHCAALGTFKPLIEIKPNQWDLTMNINARAFLICAQKCLNLKIRKIVAISSLGSQRALPNYGAMGPTKAALESLIRYLAAELAPQGIQVNGVTGGFIETDSIKKFPNFDRLVQQIIQRTPAQRMGRPDDIADVVMFLINSQAEWIYGQTIVADGGISLL